MWNNYATFSYTYENWKRRNDLSSRIAPQPQINDVSLDTIRTKEQFRKVIYEYITIQWNLNISN